MSADPDVPKSSSLAPIQAFAAWAALESSRARYAGEEWRAAGLTLAAIYALVAILPRGSIFAIDLVTTALFIGVGLLMRRHCWRNAVSLQKLSDGLRRDLS